MTRVATPPQALPEHAPAHRALRSTSWLLAENLVRLGITAVVSFWAARALGPADFGLLNAASALAAILLAASTLGLEVPAVLRLARGEAEGAVLGTLLRLRFIASLLALAAAAAAALLLRAGDVRAQTVMVVVALSIVGYVPTVFDYAFKARVDAGPPARARLATTLLSAAAKVLVLASGAGVVALAWTVVLEAVLASALLYRAWHQHPQREQRSRRMLMGVPLPGSAVQASVDSAVHLHHSPPLAAALLRQSLPLLAAAAAVAVQLKADVVLIGHLASDLQAGHYALAQKLSEVLYVVPVVLVDSIYPLLATRLALQQGLAGSAEPAPGDQLMFDLAAGAGMLCSVACLLLAQPLILGTFGTAYEAAVPLWQWHGLTCTAVALDVARQRWLVARGLQAQALHGALLGAALVVTLNLLLLPTLGAQAAAAIAVVAWFSAGVLATLAWQFDTRTRALAGLQWRALFPWLRLWRQLQMLRRRPGERA